MPKFNIYYDFGYGEHEDEVEAKDLKEAEEIAYKTALDFVGMSLSYHAELSEEEDD